MPTIKGDPELPRTAGVTVGRSVGELLESARREGRLSEATAAPLPPGTPQPKKKRGRPEYEFQRAVIALAQLRGWLVAHFRSVPVRDKSGRVYHQTPVDADGAGFPDLVLLRDRRAIAAELKAGSNRPGPDQERWLAAFRMTAGVETYVWHPDLWQDIERTLR